MNSGHASDDELKVLDQPILFVFEVLRGQADDHLIIIKHELSSVLLKLAHIK